MEEEISFWKQEAKQAELAMDIAKAEILREKVVEGLVTSNDKSVRGLFDVEVNSKMSEHKKLEKLGEIVKKALAKAYPRKSDEFKALKLVELATKSNAFGGASGEFALVKTARAYMRNRVESWRVLQNS